MMAGSCSSRSSPRGSTAGRSSWPTSLTRTCGRWRGWSSGSPNSMTRSASGWTPLGAMAQRRDPDFTYLLTDRIVRPSLSEVPDLRGAKYDGDFSLSLEQAQRRKHDYVADQIGIAPDRRVVDLGCGWGGLLAYIRAGAASAAGPPLSSAQEAACRRHGLDVHLQDARRIEPGTFGTFDAAASLGAFEHFCSPDEYWGGRQDEIYRD